MIDLTVAVYILILSMSFGSAASTTTAEFKTLAGCQAAAEQVKKDIKPNAMWYTCVPKK